MYLGFGSMPDHDPAQFAEVMVDAVLRAGKRAVLLAGWSGLRPSDSTDDVVILGDLPHSWLFPRMAVVVHNASRSTRW